MDSLLGSLFEDGILISGVISSPRSKEQSVHKIVIRPVSIKRKPQLQVSEHHDEKVIHRNVSPAECRTLIRGLLVSDYKQALFHTLDHDYHVLLGKKNRITILKKPPTKSVGDLSHNRSKNYVLEEGVPIPFLVKLGVMNAMGKVHADRRDKFKQINRFLEIVSDVISAFEKKKTIRILDFGCGKAYLSFALYHYLHHILHYDVEMIGLDLKKDVIIQINQLAQQMEFKNLHFVQGDINTYECEGMIDLMVTLHACDTATDAALEKAVRWGAKIILSVPCCQHELFSQVSNSSLKPLLQHGLLKERFAALATDAARGKLLECLGYHVQIIEFIDPEHTPKNILIRAVRKSPSHKCVDKKALAEYRAFKEMLIINPSLEKRFKHELETD